MMLILDMDLEKSILQKPTAPLTFQFSPFLLLFVEGASSGELSG